MERVISSPLCTVIIPLFNKKMTVSRTIRSIKAQTLNNLECVIVNNNSTDNPDEVVLAEIAGDARFSYVNCAAQGVANARNFGCSMAQAPFLLCLDSDDAIEPTFLEVCVAALRADVSLGMAYTGLVAVDEAGGEHLSQWPGEFDYDAFLSGRNQVPTATVFRKEAWRRAGGYRQRYAAQGIGAGAEDANFFLRLGALGWGAKKVTDEGLFRYHLGGSVSANPDYQEPDWRANFPFIYDGLHPFASLASPVYNGISHPVRQVDDPEVSIIIPVGPGHLQYLVDALDSVSGQSFRKWEVIVVDDGVTRQEDEEWQRLMRAFPFVRQYRVGGTKGAGHARNCGAALARAPNLLFLDADDWLSMNALDIMLRAAHENPGEIIYSDYWGYAYIGDPKELARLERAGRLAYHDAESQRTIIRYHASEYDCGQALRQPDPSGKLYIWNVISSLVPRAYHEQIGGFDEEMDSWEDWDLWLRMARAGHCFTRVAQPLLHYRFYSGQRRALANPGESGDDGRQVSAKLLEYMSDKYERNKPMPCGPGCGGKRKTSPSPAPMMMSLNEGRVAKMSSNDLVEVELVDGNIGEHLIAFSQVNYGYRKHGDHFRMARNHAELDRRVRIVGAQPAPQRVPAPSAPRQAPPPPPGASKEEVAVAQKTAEAAPKESKDDKDKQIVIKSNAYPFEQLWGIDEEREKALLGAGIRSLNGLLATSTDRLTELLNVSESVAKQILSRAEQEKK